MNLPGAILHSNLGLAWHSAATAVAAHQGRELIDGLMGYAASAAVFGTFLMRKMVPLRLLAIVSNVLFIAYGYAEHIYPVLCLHIALLPINAQRLMVAAGGLRSIGSLLPEAVSLGLLRRRPWLFALGLIFGSAGGWVVIRALEIGPG